MSLSEGNERTTHQAKFARGEWQTLRMLNINELWHQVVEGDLHATKGTNITIFFIIDQWALSNESTIWASNNAGRDRFDFFFSSHHCSDHPISGIQGQIFCMLWFHFTAPYWIIHILSFMINLYLFSLIFVVPKGRGRITLAVSNIHPNPTALIMQTMGLNVLSRPSINLPRSFCSNYQLYTWKQK